MEASIDGGGKRRDLNAKRQPLLGEKERRRMHTTWVFGGKRVRVIFGVG